MINIIDSNILWKLQIPDLWLQLHHTVFHVCILNKKDKILNPNTSLITTAGAALSAGWILRKQQLSLDEQDGLQTSEGSGTNVINVNNVNISKHNITEMRETMIIIL